MELRKAIGARQADYGVWTGQDGTDGNWPWTLRESFNECTLAREYARPGELVRELPDDSTDEQIFDALAVAEGVRTFGEQWTWIRETHPEEFDGDGNWKV